MIRFEDARDIFMHMQKQRTQTTDFHFTIFKKPDIENRVGRKKLWLITWIKD